MNKRPPLLTYLAFAFLLVALSLPAQIMWIYGHTFNELFAVTDKLTVLNWAVMLGCACVSYLLLGASPRLRWVAPALIAVVIVNNFFVGYYATDFSPWQCALSSCGFALLNAPLLTPKIRWLLQHPDRRWWLRAERKRVAIPIFIEGARLDSLRAQSFDISETGMFVPLESRVGVGDHITVRMKFGAFSHMKCQGRVVRRGEPKGTYPAGVGIEFTDLSWHQRRELRKHLSRSGEALV
jgi:hypothetical protein